MDQVLASVFSAENLRFDVIEGDGDVDIRVVLARVRIGFDVEA